MSINIDNDSISRLGAILQGSSNNQQTREVKDSQKAVDNILKEIDKSEIPSQDKLTITSILKKLSAEFNENKQQPLTLNDFKKLLEQSESKLDPFLVMQLIAGCAAEGLLNAEIKVKPGINIDNVIATILNNSGGQQFAAGIMQLFIDNMNEISKNMEIKEENFKEHEKEIDKRYKAQKDENKRVEKKDEQKRIEVNISM
ncbi:MAG: hypothetical protein DKM50_11045 [Candidatus Margulisiibacteriota bacterium]|nr:MAG: hypothetical protein A2X43_07855 [Candidatus Margulisbacteria bacterium GWD2_39_127]OGI04687.1 MAG: hypothetical protein A2X42_11055 [Candidatus Margulisbacteria bacterium GWF2_38_17]PZM78663.1 MAG: hypothetical protein DKM50_11045 [Candidatus Margulisiibacteriota bacterium]HAR62005.1 hypothetical protein [Candidatus Margulisiibacteriota bacterium]HCT86279.1 hypothetical protein [Candidatus Margulisiibacteriota bacterium]